MNPNYRANWPIPDPYLIELGRLTALWASLESLLNTSIGALAGFDTLKEPTGFILVAHASFPQRLDMLGALCEELKDQHPNLVEYKDVTSKMRSAQSKRNRFSHNTILYEKDQQRCLLPEASARGKVKASVSPVTVEAIHEAAKEVHLATAALYKLIYKQTLTPVWEQ